jgi:hypothetical protein
MPKLLISLAALAFLLAVFVSLFGPIYFLPAETFSRASNNLALLAIGIALCWRGGSIGKE